MEWRKYRLEMVAETNVAETYECQLTTREKVASFLRSIIRLDKSDRERVVVMAIASDRSLIGYQEVSVGDLSSAVIHEFMSRGLTLTKKEMEKVVELVIRDNEFRTYEELCNDFEVGK